MNERSRTCDTIFRRNAFLFFFSFSLFFFFFISNHFHIYFFATISTLWHITFAIAIFISRVYILNYHRLHAIKTQTNRFILSLSFILRSLSLIPFHRQFFFVSYIYIPVIIKYTFTNVTVLLCFFFFCFLPPLFFLLSYLNAINRPSCIFPRPLFFLFHFQLLVSLHPIASIIMYKVKID